MKRIAYCIPALYNSGGMERILSVKANYLAERGYEIHIITTDQMADQYSSLSIRLFKRIT